MKKEDIKSVSEIIEESIPYYKKRKEMKEKGLINSVPLAEHVIGYDSSSETLEPIYFFILDLMNDFGLETEKLVDNFTSSPGSGHFAELGQRATIMQQQGSKILGDVNNVLRSILNIVYDLKEFRTRLQHYDSLKSGNKDEKEAAVLSLKQIWMDRVDITKGNSSIKAMATAQVGYQTLIDAFLVVKDEKDVDKLDLNDRIKRILKPRIQEFNVWISQSERELRKRYELEKTYLKSQMNSVKLYSRWVKPYLKAAQQLEMKEVEREPGLVKTFNTILLELTLLGKSKVDLDNAVVEGTLSPDVAKLAKRDYFACILVDFKFRGIPQRLGGQQAHYAFGGKVGVTFSAFVLNSDELEKLEEGLEKSDVEDVLKLIEGITTESLDELQKDINSFLEEKTEEERKKEKPRETSNPFLALVGHYEKKPKEKKKEKAGEVKKEILVKPDNFMEKNFIRPVAEEKAKDTLFTLFDVYKKAHGMSSYT